ncbi:LamG-like jellyroll fold domain-containing protein [Gemmata sp.]|uniref:LamG-like jellyroll fold domain-containing protein n=1 Tax=Gemmata sp. TaxID=1914242 RepID=UPI003F6EC134
MTPETPEANEHDLAELVAAWLGAPVPDDRRAALLARLGRDPTFRAAAAEQVRLLGMLQVVRAGAPRWLRLEDELGWSAEPPPAALGDAVAARIARMELEPRPRPARKRTRWAAVAAAVAATVIAAVALLTGGRATGPADRIAVVAHLGNAVWEGDGPAERAVVGPGVLALRTGSVTLALFNGVTVHMEGPARFELQSLDRVYCRSGKFRINSPAEAHGFVVAANRTEFSSAAEFALTVDGAGTASVAVADGRTNVCLLNRSGRTIRTEALFGGQAALVADGTLQPLAAPQPEGRFIGAIPVIASPLPLSPTYAQTVLAARPAAYWRFESAADRAVGNEVAGGPPLRIVGDAALGERADGNRGLSLPHPTEEVLHGAITEGAWAPRGREYTVECWAMPRLVRQASVLGMVAAEGGNNTASDRHGLLLELTGQPSPYRHPSRTVRALHRLPAGKGRGVNLFAPGQYLPYSWQHLVLRQSGPRLELYVNGELAGLGAPSDDGPFPRCRIVLGALHASQDGNTFSGRPFVGAIDEVAVYDHALAPEEIARHHALGSGSGPQ